MLRSVTCGGVWTGEDERPLGPCRIHISEGRIHHIEEVASSTAGPFALPGFVDAHCHFTWTGMEELLVDLKGTCSADDFLQKVSAAVSDADTGRILRGYGFDESNWTDEGLPSLEELDGVTGSRPAILVRICGHMAMVNSAMINLLPNGAPGLNGETGIISEGVIFDLSVLFPPEDSIIEKAVRNAAATALSTGVTGICSFEYPATARYLSEHSCPVDTCVFVYGRHLDAMDETLIQSSDGLKFFLDGSIGASTAAVSGSYRNGTSVRPIMSGGELARSMELAEEHGSIPSYHAIGGKALKQLIDSLTDFRKKAERPFPARVEHAEELLYCWPDEWDPELDTFVMQPNFVSRWQKPGGLYEKMLGDDRSRNLNPFKQVLDAGFRMCFGSDGMPFGPLKGLFGATDHPLQEFSLSVSQALRAYTLDAASVCGFQDAARPLSPGRVADITLLSASPFEEPWENLEIRGVFSGGEKVFGEDSEGSGTAI
ncbi:MAG: amidohydrolase family protein [Candidatus Aegiribacteria sp.]|nr:amidohydrolase family protein [Candidatus Aegiribacteria sp.]MBD3294700.1 amidohydrolase family protein [Candidatus Fermentibacteria bacterium]